MLTPGVINSMVLWVTASSTSMACLTLWWMDSNLTMSHSSPSDNVSRRQSCQSFSSVSSHSGTALLEMSLILWSHRFLVDRKVFFSIVLLAMVGSWFMLEHFRVTRSNWWQRSDFMERFCNSFLMGINHMICWYLKMTFSYSENNDVVEKPIDLVSLSNKLVDKTVEQILFSNKDERPFLLYHSFAHVHTPLVTHGQYRGRSSHGVYGDTVMEMDAGVGRIMAALKEAGVEEDTLVYLTSDHGGDHPQLGDQGGYNGVFRGGKGNGALEGGMRIPGIINWPRVVQPGSEISEVTSLLDIVPTVRDILSKGKDSPVDSLGHTPLDGVSMLDLLTRKRLSYKQRTIFHFCDNEIFALRTQMEDGRIFKMILQEPILQQNGGCAGALCPCYGPGVRVHSTPLLYNIKDDPTESNHIDPQSQLYGNISEIMKQEYWRFLEDLNTSKMSSQYENMLNILPMPWLQPFLNV